MARTDAATPPMRATATPCPKGRAPSLLTSSRSILRLLPAVWRVSPVPPLLLGRATVAITPRIAASRRTGWRGKEGEGRTNLWTLCSIMVTGDRTLHTWLNPHPTTTTTRSLLSVATSLVPKPHPLYRPAPSTTHNLRPFTRPVKGTPTLKTSRESPTRTHHQRMQSRDNRARTSVIREYEVLTTSGCGRSSGRKRTASIQKSSRATRDHQGRTGSE